MTSHRRDPTTLSALHEHTTPSAPNLSSDILAPRTVDIPHYGLTHPKAYIGYTIALATADSPTDAANRTTEYVVGAPEKARLGASNLGLITHENATRDSAMLTTTGHELVTHARETFGTLQNALEHFDGLRGTQHRLCTLSKWNPIVDSLATANAAADHLITLLQTIHTERNDPPGDGLALPELVHELYYEDPAFAVELLIRDSNRIRNQLVDAGTFNHDLLTDASAYRGAGVYQFKNVLYHLGVLTTRGSDTSSLTPPDDVWALEADWRGDA